MNKPSERTERKEKEIKRKLRLDFNRSPAQLSSLKNYLI